MMKFHFDFLPTKFVLASGNLGLCCELFVNAVNILVCAVSYLLLL